MPTSVPIKTDTSSFDLIHIGELSLPVAIAPLPSPEEENGKSYIYAKDLAELLTQRKVYAGPTDGNWPRWFLVAAFASLSNLKSRLSENPDYLPDGPVKDAILKNNTVEKFLDDLPNGAADAVVLQPDHYFGNLGWFGAWATHGHKTNEQGDPVADPLTIPKDSLEANSKQFDYLVGLFADDPMRLDTAIKRLGIEGLVQQLIDARNALHPESEVGFKLTQTKDPVAPPARETNFVGEAVWNALPKWFKDQLSGRPAAQKIASDGSFASVEDLIRATGRSGLANDFLSDLPHFYAALSNALLYWRMPEYMLDEDFSNLIEEQVANFRYFISILSKDEKTWKAFNEKLRSAKMKNPLIDLEADLLTADAYLVWVSLEKDPAKRTEFLERVKE